MNSVNGINTRTILVNRDNELAAMLQIGGRYALVMNDPELAAMAAGQGVQVIYRESGDAPEDEPLRQDPAAFVQKRAEHAQAAAYIHLLNEIDPSADEQRWSREAFKYAKSIKRRLLVGNYATHRSREQWEFARPLLAEAAGAGYGIGIHHYVPPGGAAGGLEWITTRTGVGGLWFVTEFAYGRYTPDGQIDPHRGWRGITNERERRAFIEKWSAYYSAKNIALLWYCYDFWDKPNLEIAKAEGFGYNDLSDVLNSFRDFNKVYTVKDVTPMPDIPAPTTGGVKAKLTTIPGDYINVRAQPNPDSATSNASADVGDLLVGDVVTYYPDAKQGEWVYQTPLTPVQRPTGRQNAAAGWASEQGGKVTFEKVVDPPPVEPEPEPEPQTITLTIDQYNVLVASLSIAQRVLADIAPMPAPAPIPVPSLPFDAIDVSQAQGVIDWQAVAQSGVRAAYIRATQGTSQIDTKFVENAQNAAAAGIAIGFYHPLIASQSGAAQAAHFLNQIKPYPWQLPPAIDVELDNDQTPTRIADELYAMATAVEAAIGQRPVLYSSWGFWNGKVGTQHDSYFAECPLWVANYTTAPAPMIPRCWSSYWLWQYTSSGSVPGIGGRVDLNRRSKETVLVAA